MALKNLTTFCLVFLSLTQLFTQVNAVCYFPNGVIAPNDTPCRDDTSNSVCCGQGYACLTNGLCQATGEELQKPGATEFVRGGCTDKTWRSSSCPSFCIENGVDNVGGGTGLSKCPNTDRDIYWCINKNYQSADCDTGVGLLFFPGTPSAITTIGVSPETTKAPSSTTTWSTLISNPSTIPTSASVAPSSIPSQPPFEGSQPTTSPEPSPDTAPSQVAVIGGAVGGAAAVLILGGLGMWWFLRKRKGRKPVESQITTVPEQHYSSPQKGYGSYAGELYGSTQMPPHYQRTKPVVPYEMSAVQLPQELPATPLHYQRF